jgi:hypothetical protein
MTMHARSGVRSRLAPLIGAAVLLASLRIAAADPLPPSTLTQISGGGQVGVVNTSFPIQLAVLVTDGEGNPVPGTSVYFEADHCHNDGTECLLPGAYPFFEGNNVDVVVTSDANGEAIAPTFEAGNVDASYFANTATIYTNGPTSTIIAQTFFWVAQIQPTPAVPITAGFTGAWYDPTQSGHGLLIEVLPQNRLMAYWFAFTPDGTQQAWFGGVGDIHGDEAVIYANQGQGGRWIPDFDPALFSDPLWGTLAFIFTDCNHGRVYFTGDGGNSIWGRSTMDITRLTMPAGLSCP